jgi:hypothetical protein
MQKWIFNPDPPPKGILSIIKRTERSLRLVGVVAPTPRRATSTPPPADQFTIFNSRLSGLAYLLKTLMIGANELKIGIQSVCQPLLVVLADIAHYPCR